MCHNYAKLNPEFKGSHPACAIFLSRGTLRFDDGGGKLCMRQFERVLTSHRIPGNGADTLKTWDGSVSNETEHIIVTSNYYVGNSGTQLMASHT